MSLRTGEVAEQCGVNLQTIRYYEREGLLPKPPRLRSGYRLFPDASVRRIQFIKRAQALGFTLAEIRELLTLRVDKTRDREVVRTIAKARLREIELKIASLQTMHTALKHIAGQCKGHGPADECPILNAIDSKDGSF